MIYENTPRIETERLILRKFNENDIEDIFRIYSDVEVNKFLPWFPFKTIDEAKNYLYDKIFPCYKRDTGYTYAIELKSDNHVIGYIHVNDIGDSNDIGYGIEKKLWHMGIATEAVKAIMEHMKNAGYTYITATHDVKNPNSGKVMQKLGMEYKYSYVEQWQPKDISVTFRMYQINFDNVTERTYMKYWHKYENHFIEENI